ncbi:class I SAM-dependent DNA methyltransferase [Hansschlegelia beijingensis]|uniref:site-specific DNA-methyltransferase (adenine-specific) n=1 Tax=Hansschlegelia beijingensis TaxID=1133344 RepID=A0A7W6GH41_9HYPH|nr:DNA methyltransferase [Hansschlegelia beijingensis]MBB3973369.1 hypothetical protein [Hansschlegelia beijingensis]
MNAVEIEEAVSALARQPFDADEFPYAFLQAFGRKDVELKRLRKNNTSDVVGGVLRRDSIHIAVAAPGEVGATLAALRDSPKSAANRVKFLIATDGDEVQAEETATGEFRSFPLPELDRHFGFFLPLAGISAVRQIKDNPIDVKAVGRLNKLYLELLRENPDWAKEEKRPELNRLMARLVFCFFAEDTGIFIGDTLFTASIRQFSEDRAGLTNTDQVLAQLFLAMSTPTKENGNPTSRFRQAAGVKAYADVFPYVNGGLFEDAGAVPRFSRAARNYLLHAGELDWKEINPDIFGSMIQAVAEDDERASLGMHYTSVPNILKVLNPLFLDELNEKLGEAGDSVRKLRALRRRLSRIRVFDPACGSGNFLVIAYRQMREIEHEIVKRTGDDPKSVIPLTNFYGIEIKGFAAEIARLALLIAEFQADSRLISQQAARSMVLPLHKSGKIVEGNALRLDWLEVCPPAAPVTEERDLGGPTGQLALEESRLSDRDEVETYICGNPPYIWSNDQTAAQKEEIEISFSSRTKGWKQLNYVSGWFIKAAEYNSAHGAHSAFVSINTICQGQHVELLWPSLLRLGVHIEFAHTSFKWSNLSTNNAGVTVVIVGLSGNTKIRARPVLYSECENKAVERREAENISPYLVPGPDLIVRKASRPLAAVANMARGNMPYDGGNLLLSPEQVTAEIPTDRMSLVRRIFGSEEFIYGAVRYCLWIRDDVVDWAMETPSIAKRIGLTREARLRSSDVGAQALALTPHRFREMNAGNRLTIVIPAVSSENRPYLTAGLIGASDVLTNRNYGIFDGELWNLALLSSKMHLVWIATVCGRLEMRYSYTNTLGWNTFPVPPLTTQDKADLTRCAEDILLAREAHFPATIADLYDPEAMPDDLRRAHERNDETLERIYIGRRFRNDTERLEHLFALYTKMTASDAGPGKKSLSKSPRKRKEKAA